MVDLHINEIVVPPGMNILKNVMYVYNVVTFGVRF